MGGCQNYGPLLGTLNIRCRIIIGIQKAKRDHTFDNHPYSYMDLGAKGRALRLAQDGAIQEANQHSYLTGDSRPEVDRIWLLLYLS